MLDFLKPWVTQIVFLALMVTIFNILIPEGKIKKFFILFSGFVMISAIFVPIANSIKKSPDIDITSAFYTNQLNKQDVLASAKSIEGKQTQLIVDEYIRKINESAAGCAKKVKGVYAASVDTIINENLESEDFGKITKMYVYLSLSTEGSNGSNGLNGSNDSNSSKEPDEGSRRPESSASPTGKDIESIKSVEKVQIGKSKGGQSSGGSSGEIPSQIKKEITDRLVKTFEMYEKDIIFKLK